jgi:hypothetical protein
MTERREEFQIQGAEIPKEWEETIAACLEKMPEQRPRDMIEVAERLGLPVGTRQTSRDTTSKMTAKTTKPAEKKQPPILKPPRKPFPTKMVSMIAGGIVAVALLGYVLWEFVLWPFIATPGSLFVTSDPPGATVHLSGQADRVTPAQFDKIRIGHYKVTISTLGYDPVESTITITEGATQNLTGIQLKRAFGKLNLVTLPPHAHYSLAGTDGTADTSKEGITPDFLPNLPAGKYQLTLSEPGIASHTDTIEIPAHDTLSQSIDLIQSAVAVNASPGPAKVFLGQGDAGQLDAKGKTELVGLYQSAFEKYLDGGMLQSAADQIPKIKAQGQDTAAQEKELTERRTSIEKEEAAQLKELIGDKKFATAQVQLQGLNGVLEKESVDRLNTQFQPQLTQYQQQVDAAIKMSQNGPPTAGYDQLKIFAAQYPNDVNLQLALAQLETQMPPDHDRLTAQLKVFKQFSAQNKDAVANPDFQAMENKFADELKQLDDLAAALTAAKNGPAGIKNEISSLNEQLAGVQSKRVGYTPNPLADTANGFSRFLTGHTVVEGGTTYTQEEKDRQINSLQQRISADQQKLAQPANDVAEAQRRYDEFVAKVPW